MRPTRLSLFVLSVLAAPLASEARASRSAALSAAHSAATQVLPPASVPEPEVVETALELAAPAPRAPQIEAWADVPDEPPIAEEIDRDSADIEAVRRAEEEAHVRDGAKDAAVEGKVPHETGAGRIELLPELDMDLAQLRAKYDIPIDVNEAVVGYVRFFQSPAARAHFVKWLGRSHRYLDHYRAILREEGLPEDTVYLAMIESGFGNFAYSHASASGPWQFIASTGKAFGLRQDFWVDERRDPERSARAAARYLKQLYTQTGDWRLAWAGYNGGGGRIQRAKDAGYDDFWDMAAEPGKKVLHPETKGYVPKLMAAAILSKHPQAFGFTDEEIEKQSWTEYEEVKIPSATLLSVLAKAAGIEERALIDLNPELRRSCTPPRPYSLKIPKANAETFAASWPAMQPKVRLTFAGHVVRRGDTLSSIAHRHGVPMQGILEMNGMKTAKKLRVGQQLLIPKPIGAGSAVASADRDPTFEPTTARARARTAVRVPAGRARTTHRVQAGDTLWSISQRLGVDLSELCRWNGIHNPNGHKLLVGKKLVVYSERG
ncbi:MULTISPECIES: lytic transglycosylase domain-containing protein [Anaeromyxobacter]|uniref:lytic transglycosylase domain-containing protein n=1 Tax=Anaeromyxobacter TaxID=161492 RepID=UPI001F56A7AC|nr:MULTISPECIES: lytic transglycosylase domain-containing protein [unclassified Anaeromyxobacter]